MTPTHVCMTTSAQVLVGETLERCRRMSYSKIKVQPTPENPVAVIFWKGRTGKVRCSTTKQADGTIALDRRYILDEAKVIAAADQDWDETKRFYAERVGEKVDLIGGDAKIALDISLNCELVGTCTAVLGEKVLVLRTSLKTNYRYGENSANGHLTVYRQVPTLFEFAKGFDPVAAEAAKLATSQAAKADRKERLVILTKAIYAAEKVKRNWDDLYSTLRYASESPYGLRNGNLDSATKDAATLGLPGIPTLAEAKLGYKSAQAAHKAAKEALKAAKADKG